MIRRLLLALTIVLSCAMPGVASAQAEWRIDGFTLTERGFRGSLLFRNGQSPFDTPIRGIGWLRITLAPDTPRCANFDDCYFWSNTVSRVGNVDTQRYDFAGGASLRFTDEVWSEDSCIRCWQRLYTAPTGIGALGCAAPYGNPGVINFYAGRTCPEAGFDGWFSLPIEWVSFEALPAGFAWRESDVRAEFGYRNLGDVNGFLVPEPRAWVLLATGVILIEIVRRGRRRARSPRSRSSTYGTE